MQVGRSQDDIRALVDSFVDQLTQKIRSAAVEAVQSALMNGGAPARATASAAKAQGRPGRPPGMGGKKAGGGKASKGGRRSRRSPEELEAARERILRHVQANPGTAMGDMSAALGEDQAVIRAQLNELLASGQLRKEGERRGTRYFAGGGRGAGGGGAKTATKTKTKTKTGKKGKRAKK